MGPQVPGGNVVLSNTTGGWSSPMSGADGSINITALTPSRIAGTFNFVVAAGTGTAAGTKTVTDGAFDLELKTNGTSPALPDNARRATVGWSLHRRYGEALDRGESRMRIAMERCPWDLTPISV